MDYPRARFDALTDGIFAVAMTLLVLDVRLPDSVDAKDAAAVAQAIMALSGKLAVYALSFAVLGLIWLGRVGTRERLKAGGSPATIGRREAEVGLIMLFLVSMTPFASIAVSHYGSTRIAIGVYCLDLGLIGILNVIQRLHETEGDLRDSRLTGAVALAASAALAYLASYLTIEHCLWVFTLNAFVRPVQKLARGRKPSAELSGDRDGPHS